MEEDVQVATTSVLLVQFGQQRSAQLLELQIDLNGGDAIEWTEKPFETVLPAIHHTALSLTTLDVLTDLPEEQVAVVESALLFQMLQEGEGPQQLAVDPSVRAQGDKRRVVRVATLEGDGVTHTDASA